MIATRLVNLIETHAERLAESLLGKLHTMEELEDYRRLPPHEIRQRAFDIYRHLTEWLLSRTDQEIETRFREIGARRAAQGIALSSVILALHVTKEHLWEYIRREGLVDRHVELCQEIELLQQIELFFDRATYFASRGYETYRPARAA